MDLPAPPPTQGFTAVILTHNRLSMLFQTLKSVAQAPSLVKVVVFFLKELRLVIVTGCDFPVSQSLSGMV